LDHCYIYTMTAICYVTVCTPKWRTMN